jgi:hypothetical protein
MVPEGFGELVAPAADYGLGPDQTFVQVHFDEPVQHHGGQASHWLDLSKDDERFRYR